MSYYIFRAVEWWYSRVELEPLCCRECHCTQSWRNSVRGRRCVCLQNNPNINLLIFISAFLKLLPFSSTLYSFICVRLIFDFFLVKRPVDQCFVGTYGVKLRSWANVCCDMILFFFYRSNLPSTDKAKCVSPYSVSESVAALTLLKL